MIDCVRQNPISLAGVTVTTHDGVTLLNDVSLELPGSHTALLGRSGSGKSLIAAALTSRVPQTLKLSGTINAPKRATLIHQNSADAFNPVVRMGHQLSIAEPDRQKVFDTLATLGFDSPQDVLQRFPAELSGGQRQRLAIAMGVLAGTELIVADEPTSALDPINQQAVVNALASIHNSTVLFITHDIALAAACCENFYIVDHGMIVEHGSREEILNAPQHAATQELIDIARSRHEVPA
ncbi:putative D,D-dipeptide transport ATP-binding protein DdpD [Corynebacterium cystitidis DSM 20524]|uniref:Peptide/nickel transport system ATP-binding protein n=1 Tax=Corynebacterium cystitidis DSM 20524 TaxID=1121357 RepID=A0A1H9WJJ5_9CORY|nr:putative D,D-dipeptide transport ATP-binding protein DdpD [Corynebacterium cystitidis DSM 20524]SES34014.1 peptide/nickel transport system ATP-binding protein [Corynebacterium cystitidis DSM 20524]SNV88084.1 ABC transporter ATP-binding protein [Corynebacterium cystitidis]